jgi:hypothetical protein
MREPRGKPSLQPQLAVTNITTTEAGAYALALCTLSISPFFIAAISAAMSG